jgi:prefoldin alpha subunit
MERLTNEEQERLQRILAQLSDSEAAVEAIRRQISALAASLTELSMTIGAIKTIKELKPDTEILVPIGSDSFINAKITRSDKVMTGLGADVAAERTAEDAIALLEARAAEFEQAVGQTHEELGQLEERMEALRPEAEKLLKKGREEPEG